MKFNNRLSVCLLAPLTLLIISSTNAYADNTDSTSNTISSQANTDSDNMNKQSVLSTTSNSNIESSNTSNIDQTVTNPDTENNISQGSDLSSSVSGTYSPNNNSYINKSSDIASSDVSINNQNDKDNSFVLNSSNNTSIVFPSLYTATYSQDQINNASYIYSYFTSHGWTSQSVAGMLGNITSESGIRPDVWESGNHQGYGLVQWTPPTAMQNWCSSNGYGYQTLEGQCAYIQYQMTHGLQFYPSKYYSMTADEYMKSQESAYTLGLVFLANFERPANPYQYDRGNQAEYWYNYFVGHSAQGSDTSTSPNTVHQNGTFHVTYSYGMNVRNSPSTNGQIIGSFSNGQSFSYDEKVQNNGYLWVSYINNLGQRAYVAIKSLSGNLVFGTDSNNFSFISSQTSSSSSESSKTTTNTPTIMKQSGNFKTGMSLNIRNTPSTNGSIEATYDAGQTIYYDEKIEADGYLWISYVSYSGVRRYVAIQNLSNGNTFGTDSNNFSFNSPIPTKPSTSTSTIKQSGSFKAGRSLNVRNAPSTNNSIASTYDAGQTIYYDEKVEADGYLWISYVSYSGTRRYVAIKNLSNGDTFGTDSNNFSFDGVESSAPSTTPDSSQATKVISIARQQLGKPYQYGAAGPNSFDCSGLVQYVFGKVGISLPRTTYEQEKMGYEVSLNNLQPGDLLFWGNRGSSYHVAIYTGNGNMLYAPEPGQNVKEIQMKYWMPSFARRIL